MASDLWPTIHAERKALAADLDGLPDREWDTPSLCGGWTVRDGPDGAELVRAAP